MDHWEEVQKQIWLCDKCKNNPRVECHLRQQTNATDVRPVRLLIIAIAPPFRRGLTDKAIAASALNDSQDNLRLFIERFLDKPWSNLTNQGVFLLHSVKCAIVPDNYGFQDPPNEVVDLCASAYLSKEIQIIRPAVILALGDRARRAVARYLGQNKPKDFRVSGPLNGEFSIDMAEQRTRIIVAKFIRGGGKSVAGSALRRAANLAGILN